MKVTRLFTNSSGQSTFEDFEIALERSGVEQVAVLRCPTSMVVNETDAGHHYD
jgi:hypothetical protein